MEKNEAEKYRVELISILEKFASSGWDLIDKPSQDWLDGKGNSKILLDAVIEADKKCGSCGCEFDPLYKRVIELKDML